MVKALDCGIVEIKLIITKEGQNDALTIDVETEDICTGFREECEDMDVAYQHMIATFLLHLIYHYSQLNES